MRYSADRQFSSIVSVRLHFKVKFDQLFDCAASSTVTTDFKLAEIKLVKGSEAYLLKLEKNPS